MENLKKPDWFDKPYKEWGRVPTYLILLATWTMREIEAQQKEKSD